MIQRRLATHVPGCEGVAEVVYRDSAIWWVDDKGYCHTLPIHGAGGSMAVGVEFLPDGPTVNAEAIIEVQRCIASALGRILVTNLDPLCVSELTHAANILTSAPPQPVPEWEPPVSAEAIAEARKIATTCASFVGDVNCGGAWRKVREFLTTAPPAPEWEPPKLGERWERYVDGPYRCETVAHWEPKTRRMFYWATRHYNENAVDCGAVAANTEWVAEADLKREWRRVEEAPKGKEVVSVDQAT